MPAVGTIKFDQTSIHGIGDIQAALSELAAGPAANLVRRGLMAGAGVVRDEARRRVKVRSGALKKSIQARTNRKRGSKTEFFAEVYIENRVFFYKDPKKPGGKAKLAGSKRKKGDSIAGKIYPRNYAHLVEFGAKPHAIGKGSKINPKKGEAVQQGRMHPGAPPQPFLRPAYFTKSDAALDAIRAKMRKDLVIELNKVAAKRMRAG